ncbi:RICIN domain-containing protein [Hymenobacter sp. IS2118]|uniref:RICIN domain-containing protein n=1 Tax=Hymenobacter sp. IS2118 TaxID=1505605 RepID=UPI000907449C|nr:RICIN domain-containing protein [Hymenobacter sp. IS2118]
MKHKYPLILLLTILLMPLVSQAQYVKIVNRATSKALEIANLTSNPTGLNSTLTPITQQTFAGTANQEWQMLLVPGTSDLYRVQNRNNRLYWQMQNNSASTNVSQGEFDANNLNQQFRFEPIGGTGYRIVTAGQLVLQIKNGSTATGAILEQFNPTFPTTPIQTWDVTTSTNAPVYGSAFVGAYKITPQFSPNKAMQVDAQSGSAGAYIVLGDVTTATTQEWSLVPVDANSTVIGPYRLVNRLSGLSLTIEGQQNTTEGAFLQQGFYAGVQAQKWYVRRVNNANPPVYGYTGPYYIANQPSGGLVVQLYLGTDKRYAGRLQIGRPIAQTNQVWNITLEGNYRGAGSVLANKSGHNAALSIYPNPVSDMLTISLPNATQPKTVTVTDMRGATSQVVRYNGNSQLDVSKLTPGIYIVTATDGQHEYRQKLIKE